MTLEKDCNIYLMNQRRSN